MYIIFIESQEFYYNNNYCIILNKKCKVSYPEYFLRWTIAGHRNETYHTKIEEQEWIDEENIKIISYSKNI